MIGSGGPARGRVATAIAGALVLLAAPAVAQVAGAPVAGPPDSVAPGPAAAAASSAAKPASTVPAPVPQAAAPAAPPANPSFELLAVQPAVAYPKHGHFDVVLTGRGFTQEPVLLIDGRQIAICWQKPEAPSCPPALPASGESSVSPPPPGATGTWVSDRELHVSGLPASELRGPHDLQLRLGDGPLSAARTVTFSRLPAVYPSLIAAALTVLLFLIVVGLIQLGPRMKTSEGFKIGPLGALFIDKETETYSLSKLQFYAWTFACIFSYAFLTLARTLVQGKVELPDLPASFPGILAISAGTTVAAVTITSVRGTAGTGPVRPSFSDLVSVGGMVVPERFQFLIWTAVGVLGFLMMVVLSDPATAGSVPALPEGFLYLSGISAFGYLGGKMARKPGPMIDGASLTRGQAGSVALEIRGRNISEDATVRLAGADLSKYASLVGERGALFASEIPDMPEANRTVRINLVQGAAAWISSVQPPTSIRRLRLVVTNPDGQMAETLLDLSTADEKLLGGLPFPPPPPAPPASPPLNAGK
jgi:hypothetical protein